MSLHRRIAKSLGYDLRRIEKTDTLYGHLHHLFAKTKIGLVLDCGAFVGEFGADCRRAGYRGPIISFEPEPSAFAKLSARAQADGQWDAVGIGVGIKSESLRFNIYPTPQLNSLFGPRREAFAHSETPTGAVEIAVRRLDDVLDERGVGRETPIFLKTDTQGNDLNVIKGLGSRLGQVRAVMTEMSVQAIYDGAPCLWDVMLYFKEHGFEPFGFATLSRDKTGGIVEYDAIFRRPG